MRAFHGWNYERTILVYPFFLALVIMTVAPRAFSQAFTVTIEAPTVQQSSLFTNPNGFGATNVNVESFEEFSPGFHSTSLPFAGNASLGSYNHGSIIKADSFGGDGGTGNYLGVAHSNPTTLTFTKPQRYFGFWWSAGGTQELEKLTFFSGNTLLESFTTTDVAKFISKQPNASKYFGNPNNGADKGELFAFINFFADPFNTGLTYDRVVLTEGSPTGFESDNHTIASSYTNLSGAAINPVSTVDLGGNPGSNDTIGVNGGTLPVTGGATIGGSGTGVLPITNGGTLTDTSTTIGQNPGSNGSVTVDGKGSNLTSTGDTTVGDGGNGSLNITNGGMVNNTNGTIGNKPGSTGVVTVDGNGSQWNNSGTLNVGPSGSGILDLSNGGAVTANGGTTVGPNGIIIGNGTITTPTLSNNGRVAPSGPNNTPGTLNINGNYQQGPTGVLDAEVGGPKPSQTDQLKVTGTATLNGTLALTSLNNFHPSSGETFQVLFATGGTKGKFNKTIDTLNTTGLTRTEIVTPNGVVITYLRPAPTPTTPTITTTNPMPSKLTAAQRNAFLVPILAPNVTDLVTPVEVWFSLANTQRFNIQNRFDDIIAGSTGFVSNVSYPKPPPTGKEILEGKGAVDGKGKEVVPSPLQPSPENRWGVWVTGYGDFVNVDDDGPRRGYDYTTGGVTVGIDYRLIDHFVIGLMGGYAHTWTDLKPTGSVGVDTGWGGLYAGYFHRGFYIVAAAFGGESSFDTNRSALLGGHAKGNSDGQVWSTFVSGGYDFHFGQLTIGPTATLQYSNEHINGFSESGSIAPVAVNSDSEETWRTDLGFRAWYKFQVGGIGIRPFVRAAWEHDFNEGAVPVSARLVDIPGTPVTIFGPQLGHDSAVMNAGVSVDWTNTISTYVSYDGQLGRDRYDSNGVSGGIRFAF
jgi:outer membrane autotransporter protein